MKILQLCRKFPYPLKDGESIAVTYLAKAYHELGTELTLLSFNTIKHFLKLTIYLLHLIIMKIFIRFI